MDRWLIMAIPPGYRYFCALSDGRGTSLADFVCRIDLTAANFDFASVRADGADLRIFDATEGTVLPHWLADFDRAGQSARLYFKTANTAHAHRLYYANPSASSVSSFASVFTHGSGFDTDWGDLATATAGTLAECDRVPAAGGWTDPRRRRVWRRMKTPQIAGTTSAPDLGARDLSITTDRHGVIVPDSQGRWVAYYGSTPAADGSHFRRTMRCVSADEGLTWTDHAQVLTPDQSYDFHGAMCGCVIKVAEGDYRMWYTGTSTLGNVCLATSADNVTWTKQGVVIPGDTAAIVDYTSGSVSVPRVRVMSDGKWTMFCESRAAGANWHVVGFTADSPDGPWTIMNSGHTVLNGGPSIAWGTDGFANPFVDEFDDGSGYLLFTNGHVAHDQFASFNFQGGFMTSPSYGGPYTQDAKSPPLGRQLTSYGVETGALAIHPTTRERVVFIQDYYLTQTPAAYSHLYRIWPITDRGGLMVSRAVSEAAVAGRALEAGTFTAEVRSWMTAHRSEDSSPYLLSLLDVPALPTPDTSAKLAGIFRVAIRRTTFANASPGDIQFLYFDASNTAWYHNGGMWTTTPTAVATTDTNREVMTALSDDGTNFLYSAVYADDGTPIASASVAKSSVKAFANPRFLLVGDLFISAYAGGMFFRQISVRPYAAVEPSFTLGASVGAVGDTGGSTMAKRLLESSATRLLESGARRLLESVASTTIAPSIAPSGQTYADLVRLGTFGYITGVMADAQFTSARKSMAYRIMHPRQGGQVPMRLQSLVDNYTSSRASKTSVLADLGDLGLAYAALSVGLSEIGSLIGGSGGYTKPTVAASGQGYANLVAGGLTEYVGGVMAANSLTTIQRSLVRRLLSQQTAGYVTARMRNVIDGYTAYGSARPSVLADVMDLNYAVETINVAIAEIGALISAN